MEHQTRPYSGFYYLITALLRLRPCFWGATRLPLGGILNLHKNWFSWVIRPLISCCSTASRSRMWCQRMNLYMNNLIYLKNEEINKYHKQNHNPYNTTTLQSALCIQCTSVYTSYVIVISCRSLRAKWSWLMTPAQKAPPCVAAELFSMRTRDPSAKNSLLGHRVTKTYSKHIQNISRPDHRRSWHNENVEANKRLKLIFKWSFRFW